MKQTRADILCYMCALVGAVFLFATHYLIWASIPNPYFAITPLVLVTVLAVILVVTGTPKMWRARITGLCGIFSLLTVLYLAYDATTPFHGANIGLGFLVMALFHATGIAAVSLALPARLSGNR